MANGYSEYHITNEHGAGSVRVAELKNTKGYLKYRPDKLYFWSGEHRRTSLFNRGDLLELVFVLVQCGLVNKSDLARLLEEDAGREDETPPPF